MTPRSVVALFVASRRALSAWWPMALFIPLAVAGGALQLSNGVALGPIVVSTAAYAAFPLVGAVISYRSGNPMGVVFRALGVVAALLSFSQGYMDVALLDESSTLPGGLAAAWLNQVLFAPFFLLTFVYPFLLFPTGRASSRRWLIFLRFVHAWTIVSVVAAATYPILDFGRDLHPPNPLGIPALEWLTGLVFDQLFYVTSAMGVLAIASLVFRYRTGNAEERVQIKWFMLAGSVLIFGLILDEVVLDAVISGDSAVEQLIEGMALLLGLLGVPIATGIAIMKYRLYDIDVIINRALVYGALTAILAVAYVAIVFGVQTILSPVTRQSDVAIAASTLAVAALFRPLRRWLQEFIDRRFYRRKFDSVQTLHGFTAHLRDEVDLVAMSEQLVGVVAQTMQPQHVSLWLRRVGPGVQPR